MHTRSGQDRRKDGWTAERINLAALAARAFDLHAAKNYLRLSGVSPDLVKRFASQYPAGLRAEVSVGGSDGRRTRSDPCTN